LGGGKAGRIEAKVRGAERATWRGKKELETTKTKETRGKNRGNRRSGEGRFLFLAGELKESHFGGGGVGGTSKEKQISHKQKRKEAKER